MFGVLIVCFICFLSFILYYLLLVHCTELVPPIPKFKIQMYHTFYSNWNVMHYRAWFDGIRFYSPWCRNFRKKNDSSINWYLHSAWLLNIFRPFKSTYVSIEIYRTFPSRLPMSELKNLIENAQKKIHNWTFSI